MINKSWFLLVALSFYSNSIIAQGYNHQWLSGSANFQISPKGKMFIDTNSYNIVTEYRKMPFKGTQGNICDANGNLLMSSNGIWIANANNDTMMNGSGINPNGITSSWSYGLPLIANNIIIPYPGDSNKYVMFHHTLTGNYCYELYSSIVDMTLDSGLGGVTNKNNIVYSDILTGGIGACRHANGRDWWIVMIKDSNDVARKTLLTPAGTTNIASQSLGFLPWGWANSAQHTFSPDGTKFITATYDNFVNIHSYLVISDFDRCSGMFSNTQTVLLNTGGYLWGLAFSSSGKFIYACSSNFIFQVDINTLAVDTVATYDGFISPPGFTCCATTFFNMYLAANGKIYITSGSGVQHIHVINYPDSAGVACDVQQHGIDLMSYLQLRAVPNHPNYYLSRLAGSPCDTLQWQGIEEQQHDFRFRIYPNPVTSNSLHIGYLLPQNKAGVFSIYDVTGKIVFKYNLPQWSNEQTFNLPKLSDGVYQCIIKSNNFIATKKLIVIDDE